MVGSVLNAVTLVWGSLKLTSINHDPTIANASYHKGNVYAIINTRKMLEIMEQAYISKQYIAAVIY